MGLFDDLPDVKKAGLFDDLPMAGASTPDPVMPTDPGATGSLADMFVPAQLPSDMVAPTMPKDGAVPAPLSPPATTAPSFDDLPDVPQQDATWQDDLKAGWLQLQQFLPGRRIKRAIGDIGATETMIEDASGRRDYYLMEAEALEAELPNLPDDESREVLRQEIDFLREKARQMDATAHSTGREKALGDIVQDVMKIQGLNSEIAALPINPAAKAVGEAETFGEGFDAALDDPLGVLRTFGLRSLPASAPSIAGAIAGQFLGGPIGAALMSGAAGHQTEMQLAMSDGIMRELADAGVDVKSPDAVAAYLNSNEAVLGDVIERALVRAGVISAADAATAGIAGKVVALARNSGRTARAGTAAAVGTTIEPIGEMAGEAGAQIASGESIQPGEVLAEGIGGVSQGGPTALAQTVAEGARNAPKAQAFKDFAKQIDQTLVAPATLGDVIQQLSTPQDTPIPRPAPPQQPVAPEADAPPVPDQPVAPAVSTQKQEEAPDDEASAPFVPEQNQPPESSAPIPDWDASVRENPTLRLKRPLTRAIIGKKGIRWREASGPRRGELTPLASEFKHRGITPQTYPGIFSPRGAADIDNIVYSEVFDTPGVLPEENGYIDRDALIDALVGEIEGRQPFFTRQSDRQAYEDYNRQLADAYRTYQAGEAPLDIVIPNFWRSEIGRKEDDFGDFFDADYDRQYEVQKGVDAALAVIDPDQTLTPHHRNAMIADIFENGGDFEEAVLRMMFAEMRSMEESQNATRTQETDGGIQGESAEGAGQPAIQRGAESVGPSGNQPGNRARAGTKEGGAIDVTDEGDQQVIPGAEKITDKDLAQRKMDEPKRGGDAAPPEGGLFDDDERNQTSLFERGNDVPSGDSVPKGERSGDGGRSVGSEQDAEQRGKSASRKGGSTVRPDATSDADGGGAGEQTSLLDAGRIGRRPPGRLGPSFLKFSFNNRTSVYQAALADAGIDPEKARLMPPDQQTPKIAKMIEDKFGVKVELPKIKVKRKNRFGRTVVESRTSISSREALDQLLDAYQNMTMLASVMGIPEYAIGLPIDGKGITLSLVSKNALRGALGMFSWGSSRKIILPGRSNSFAHEWGHALDHYLNNMVDNPTFTDLLTQNMDKKGLVQPLSPRRLVTEAFAHVMWSMFGDGMTVNALVLELQVQSAELGADGKPTKKAKDAQRLLTDMREGRRPPERLLSKYFKSSKEFDDLYGGGGYFTDPAEMFARAFEAWVGRSVAQISDLPQSFLSKGQWAYDSDHEDRLAMTFPKDTDADQFSIAMTRLSQAIRSTNLFGPDAAPKAPTDVATFDNNDLLRRAKRPGAVAQEVEEYRKFRNRLHSMIDAAISAETWRKKGRGIRRVYQTFINTQGEAMKAIANRQESAAARRALHNIRKQVAKDPGSGEATGAIYQEEVEMSAKRRVQKVRGAIRKRFGAKYLTDTDLRIVRGLLVGEKPDGTTAQHENLAGDLRGILNEIWYDLKNAGVSVGYQADYLPHILDTERVDADQDGFKVKAAEVYGLLFDREIVESDDPDTQGADINAVIRGLRRAFQSMPDGEREAQPRLSETDEAMITTYRETRKRVKDLQRRQAKSEDPDKYEDKIAAAIEDHETAKAEMLDMLRDRYSDHAAEKWFIKMGVGQINDFGTIGPASAFLEGRTLPKETGSIMAGFMQEDPIEMIQGYSFAAARIAEYAKRFGADHSKLETMLSAARDAGVSKEDIDAMKEMINGATGRMEASSVGYKKFATFFFTIGTLGLLTFATFTSLVESMVAGMRTGRTRDSFNGIIQNVDTLVRKGKREELISLANTIGLIAPHSMETVMENRMGADALDISPASQRAVQRFFVINGLTPLTNFQRVSMQPIAHSFILSLLREVQGGRRSVNSALRDQVAGERDGFAKGELNELGISKADRADLLEWLESLDGMPKMEDLFAPNGDMHPAGEIYSRAINRLVNEIIQNPLKTDRAVMANHPDHAAKYGIMSFIDAFTRNILLRNLKRGVKDTDSLGVRGVKRSANVALAMAPYAALLGGHVLTTILREALLNQDRWEEKREEGELEEWLFERAFARTGVLGRLDPLVQLVVGIKYERDLTTVTAGPYLGYFLQQMFVTGKALMSGYRNSKNTNTTEYNAVRAAYRLMIQPALAFGISSLGPAGPASQWISRGLLYSVSKHDTSAKFADTLVGEKGLKHRGDPPWWETGDGLFQ